MPVIIKDFTWSQTNDEIILRIPIKGIIPSKTNIFTCENVVKLNFPPFYFEAFLLHLINEKLSRCRLMEDEAIFYLRKKENIEWKTLEADVDKKNKIHVKEQVQKHYQDNLIAESKEKASLKEELKREEIRKEIERETNTRTAIETIRKSACQNEMKSIESWEQKKMISPIKEKNLFLKPTSPDSIKVTLRPKPNLSFKDSREKLNQLPGIRNGGNIEVSFSKRNFSTPKRESQETLEMEWLTKQHEARKSIGFIEEDLRPEERNPKWLKDKGDDFFEKRNYLAAISAYSTAIRLTEKYFDLYLNRSAAHFAIENYQRCVEDCTKAFELLTPPVQSNLAARIQCLIRRGNGLFKLGFIKQAYQEIIAAIKLDPSDEILRRDAEMMRCKLEHCDSD